MDPSPNSHPILSYVLKRLPSIKTAGTPRLSSLRDLEQPPLPPSPYPSPRAPSGAAEFELVQRMPGLRNPSVLASMMRAVADINCAREAIRQLDTRPDHELVHSGRAFLRSLSDSPRDPVESGREVDEKAAEIWEVVRLDEEHEAYEVLLREAEEKLERVYRMAMQGRGVVEGGGRRRKDEGSGAVDDEVVRVLRAVEEGKAVERVILADRQLHHLPDHFGRIRGLLVLDVSRNQLQTVPDAIAGLEHLEELRLGSNALVALPDSIGLLSNLKILDVSGNKLRSLPDSISKCRSLVELNASYNVLVYLPTDIGHELVKLRKLWVHLNKLQSLPSSICEMRSLRLLDAHFNELHGLPSAFGDLAALESLDLSSNFSDMHDLPASFGNLLRLRELDLSNNQIHELPDCFGRLDRLERLSLDHNPIAVPPKDVVDKGVGAVKEYMAKRLRDEEERQRSAAAAAESPKASSSPMGWLSRSVSSLSTWAKQDRTVEEKTAEEEEKFLEQDL
uniref:Uncharacterized protein n=1 Tax=Avena sativa TaxID=4498 RepID=A0ACD5ZIZ0_AVESA